MTIDTHGLTWAQKFHETYERLAPQFGYETRADTRQFESESKNRQLMIAVCGEIVREAERAQMERDCAAMCDDCEKSPPEKLMGQYVHRFSPHYNTMLCQARFIRARFAATHLTAG